MRANVRFFIVLSGLFLFSACATFSSGCREVFRHDKMLFSLKEIVGSTVVLQDSPLLFGPIGSDQRGLPNGFRLPPSPIMVNTGNLSFAMYKVEDCGEKIKYNARLFYSGQYFSESHGELKPNIWSVVFRDPAKNTEILVKVIRSKT
jgi:hypothetical protein